MNYRGLNNLRIKNSYPMLLIKESLDCLVHAKRFTQLDLPSTYHQMQIRKANKWKWPFLPNTATLNTRLCFLVYLTLQLAFRAILIKSLPKNSISFDCIFR